MREFPVLPYPIGINIQVFRDDGNWQKYRAWFLRTHAQIEELFVARITLAHFEDSEDPAYSHSEWCRKAESLVDDYPNCIFIYGANSCETTSKH